MRKSLSILIVFVSALLLLSSQVYAWDKLIPLKVGQTFTFTVKDGDSNTWEQVLAVTGNTTIPSLGKTFFHLDIMDVGKDGPLDDPEMETARSTSTKVFSYDGFGVEHLVFHNAPRGTCWSYEDFDGEITEACIEAKGITVTVPAGTFTGCLRIRKTCVTCDDDYYIEWLKPGFMVVKWIDYWTSKPEPVIYKLKSWAE